MHHRESRCSDREGATRLDALKLGSRLDTPAPGEPMTARVHAHAPCSDTYDSTPSLPPHRRTPNLLGTIRGTSAPGPF